MNLHEEFYDLRDRIWKCFENTVREGCDYIGDFPIIIDGKVHDTDTMIIYGIVKDENYSLFPKKNSGKDLNISINKIKVLVKKDITNDIKSEIEVQPDILDLQELSTYLSGGFSIH